MAYLLTRRLPCSVCGLVTFRRDGWLLVSENRWLDRLRVFNWHPSLAAQDDFKSACCRQHLKMLIKHWLEQASLRLLPEADPRSIPIGDDRAPKDFGLDQPSAGRLVGELSVHRESFSRSWTGSLAALEYILDGLVPATDQSKSDPNPCVMDFPLFDPPPGSSPGLALH